MALPAEIGRGSSEGLKRERLALVGERKDARGVVLSSGGTDLDGEVLRRLGPLEDRVGVSIAVYGGVVGLLGALFGISCEERAERFLLVPPRGMTKASTFNIYNTISDSARLFILQLDSSHKHIYHGNTILTKHTPIQHLLILSSSSPFQHIFPQHRSSQRPSGTSFSPLKVLYRTPGRASNSSRWLLLCSFREPSRKDYPHHSTTAHCITTR